MIVYDCVLVMCSKHSSLIPIHALFTTRICTMTSSKIKGIPVGTYPIDSVSGYFLPIKYRTTTNRTYVLGCNCGSIFYRTVEAVDDIPRLTRLTTWRWATKATAGSTTGFVNPQSKNKVSSAVITARKRRIYRCRTATFIIQFRIRW